jgi:hypothetical protein
MSRIKATVKRLAKINKTIKDSAIITKSKSTMLKNTKPARPTVFGTTMNASERKVSGSQEPRGW